MSNRYIKRGDGLKKIILLMVIVLTLISVGCNEKDIAKESIETQKEQGVREILVKETERSLQGLKDLFKEEGFEVGENEVLAFQMLNAGGGIKFKLGSELIEIYEYDLGNLSDEAKITVDQAEKGSVDMSGFNIPVVYKEGFMIARYEDHSQKEKILEIFNRY